MAEKESLENAVPFYPNHFLKEVIVMCVIMVVLTILTVFLPAPMEEPADPFVTPTHLKPEWYFLANYKFLQLAEYLDFIGAWAPKVLGIIGQIIVVLIVMLFPFFDKNPERHPRRRPIMVSAGIIVLILYVVLVYLGYVKH